MITKNDCKGDTMSDVFEIRKDEEKIASINRTIRFKPELFDRMVLESEKAGVSFNKAVNQCIEYALDHMEPAE